jgi:hypothetical protein
MANQFGIHKHGLLLVVLLIAQSGCAGKNLLSWNRDKTPVADQRNPVRKIVCIWEPVQGQGLDGLPTRGFAGNIMFFTTSSPKPATSEGDVRVYLFHDRGTPEEQARPLHQFDFKGKAWATHLNDSIPGPSYRIFIPYVDKQPYQVNCGLRIRLTPPGGQPVYSEMVHVRLPGPSEDDTDENAGSSQQLKLPRKSADVSDFQLGATLHRKRRPLAGETTADPESLNVQPGLPLQPGLEASASIPMGDDLQQLLQQAAKLPPRELVRGMAPTQPESTRRFRMSPSGTRSMRDAPASSVPEQVIQPEPSPATQTSPSTPHPLDGY